MLSLFPHLSDSEFEKACHLLLERFDRCGARQDEWISVEIVHQHEMRYLRITRPLPSTVNDPRNHNGRDEMDELEEDDDDEVLPITLVPQASINYDIVRSPVYQVPVLYISILDPQHRFPPTLATLYQHLIPPRFKSETEHVGVIGGITITDHPATNRPVFFIHPCQTVEVMEASVGGRDVTAEEYLMVWIGALGKCVGLNVPLALVRADEDG